MTLKAKGLRGCQPSGWGCHLPCLHGVHLGGDTDELGEVALLSLMDSVPGAIEPRGGGAHWNGVLKGEQEFHSRRSIHNMVT